MWQFLWPPSCQHTVKYTLSVALSCCQTLIKPADQNITLPPEVKYLGGNLSVTLWQLTHLILLKLTLCGKDDTELVKTETEITVTLKCLVKTEVKLNGAEINKNTKKHTAREVLCRLHLWQIIFTYLCVLLRVFSKGMKRVTGSFLIRSNSILCWDNVNQQMSLPPLIFGFFHFSSTQEKCLKGR